MSTRLIYDISIWEEIRSVVCWKTPQLVGNMNKEIPEDISLAEFQGKQPIPWQLKQIMEHRANAWVQRIYDLCCDVYRNSGKAISEDFDRAVWAYRIEPFIMGEQESDIHSSTMSGFLELLLCAVGSPKDKRALLKVSQKDCCLAVRRKVCETWHDKLHHLPPRHDEAGAALTRSKPAEHREAPIVAGLPPEPGARLSTPTPLLAQSAGATRDQTTPVRSPATVPASPPLGSVQKYSDTKPPEVTSGDMPTQSRRGGTGTWDTIDILFLSDERVQIRNNKNLETCNYAEFGFGDGRTGKPNQAWGILLAVAKKGGVIRDGTEVGKSWSMVEKRVQEIRSVLREHFGISADPIPFVSGIGYRARFKIGCGPSFHT